MSGPHTRWWMFVIRSSSTPGLLARASARAPGLAQCAAALPCSAAGIKSPQPPTDCAERHKVRVTILFLYQATAASGREAQLMSCTMRRL